jgi:hypothetical protein
MLPELYSVGVQTLVEIRHHIDTALKNPIHDVTFLTNRLMPQFKHTPYQMVKMADLIGSLTQKPQASYELICKEEYERGGGY